MSKFKEYEVIFRTWNVRSYVVVAADYDDAIHTAENNLLIDLNDGEEYETMDIIERELQRTERDES